MKLLTISEFSRSYRIGPRTIWTWVRKGRLKALRDSGGRVFRLIDPEWPVFDQSGDADLVERYAVLRPGEVALLAGVHPATIRKLVYQGRLKPILIGSQRRYSVAAVRGLIAERTLGHKPKNRMETSLAMVRWASWRLGLSQNKTAT